MREIDARIRNGQIPPEARSRIEKLLNEIDDILSDCPSGPKRTDDTIFIWCDGACSGNPGPGGWGTILQADGECFEFSGSNADTTNNIMELTGALEGIKRTPRRSRIVLISDSRYLVNGMKSWMRNWKKNSWKKADGSAVANRDIWMELDRESQYRDITWEWTKGHSNHPQNDRCDELARQAIKEFSDCP